MRLSACLAVVMSLAALVGPALSQPADLIPARRMVLTENTDLPGGDLGQMFDVTAEACVTACLADAACTAITFNAHAGACFPKAQPGAPVPFQGAYAGRVLTASPEAAALAQSRAAAAAEFLTPDDLAAARDQAAGLSGQHLIADLGVAEMAGMARDAAAAGDLAAARRLAGAAVNLGDGSDLWAEYARLWIAGAPGADPDLRAARLAAANAWLRAPGDAEAAEALFVLASADLAAENGKPAIAALRLAQTLAPRDDIAAALADAEGRFGFRITDHAVESDPADARLCAVFSDLLDENLDYAPYVALPAAGLPVSAEGARLCVGGLAHGQRYALTFRAGLPSATGERLAADVGIAQYVRDRAAQVRFEGRAYVLPAGADSGLPVVSVNTDALDLRLFRVTDRNLVRTLREDYLGRPMDHWTEENFGREIGEEVWHGQADVGRETNRDVTTRLPIQQVTGPLGAGIYALQAAIPGADPESVPPATQWFVITDLGITTLSGAEGLTVAVLGLSDAAPRAGARVALLSRGNAVLAEATTDDSGIARFGAAATRGRDNAAPAAVTVSAGEDLAFLPLNDPEFDLSDRGVEGLPPAPPVDVFLTTDRGAYRAGETVQATILARNGADQRALSGLPLTAALIRPDGVEFARMLAPEAGAGGHTAAFALPATAPRGTWRLEVMVDPEAPPLASQKLLVEDFLPERIEVTASLPDTVSLTPGAPVAVALDARWLFGAPGAGLHADGEVRLAPAATLSGHDGFRFGRHDRRMDPVIATLAGATTDDAGRATLTGVLPEATGAAAGRPLTAEVVVAVREGSGRPVERRIERPVLPAVPVAGIRPLFADDAVSQGAEARFALVVLDPQGQPMAGAADWVLNRVETDYQWYALDGQWNYEPITRRSEVARGRADLTAQAPAELAVTPDWGRFELLVTPSGSQDGSGAASYTFDAGWYAAQGSGAQTPDRLDVSLDRADYRAGDTAIARIAAPRAGRALVSVLTNRVVDLRLVDLAAGENRVDLPVTDAWGTGAYVAASAIRPLAGEGEAGHAPIRALGLAHAAIAPGDRALSAAIEAPAAADPRGMLPVTLRVSGAAPGDPVLATLAAVDLGILNLTGFAPPDPSAHYFGQRRLGVGIRDLYGRLIDGQAGTPGTIRSGGDASAALTMQAPPPTEALMAWFSGPLTVGADGTVTAEVPLPAFNGTVRLMAVVWSARGVGQANADVLVRDPVVLTASAPRFMAPGDQARVLLDLTHASGPAGEMALEATAEGITTGALPGTVTLADKGTQRLVLPVTAPADAAPGNARIVLALTTPEGRRLEQVVTVPIRANGPETRHESRFTLAAGDDLTLPPDLLADLRPGSGRAMLAIGPAARFDSAAIMAALADYPYGCTEQVTSQAMPLLAFAGAAATDLPATLEASARIDQAVAKVLTRQDSSGAFGLWGPTGGDAWLDAYVTDFLSRARAAGHAVPDLAFRAALDNLRNRVNYAPDFAAEDGDGGAALAYALMVLAREGAAAIGDLRYYADVKAGDFGSPLAVAQLGAALASVGDPTRADALFAQAAGMLDAADAPEPQVWRADYGTRLRDRAGVLALAAAAGSQAAGIEALGRSLEDSLTGQTLSPQEAVWSLLAAGALSPGLAAAGFTLDGAPVTGALMRDVTLGGAGAVLHNGSPREAMVTLTRSGVPAVPEPAGGKGYSIARDYYTPEGAPVDPARVAHGARLVAVLTVTPHGPDGSGGRLMVEDPLPAGFEIDNPHLLAEGDLAALDWLGAETEVAASEFREDRFLTAIDWTAARPFRLAYRLRAITPGDFAHPAASVQDMYRPDHRAWTASGRVVVNE